MALILWQLVYLEGEVRNGNLRMYCRQYGFSFRISSCGAMHKLPLWNLYSKHKLHMQAQDGEAAPEQNLTGVPINSEKNILCSMLKLHLDWSSS